MIEISMRGTGTLELRSKIEYGGLGALEAELCFPVVGLN